MKFSQLRKQTAERTTDEAPAEIPAKDVDTDQIKADLDAIIG